MCHYLHLNPVRAGIVPVARLEEFRPSSYLYLGQEAKRHRLPPTPCPPAERPVALNDCRCLGTDELFCIHPCSQTTMPAISFTFAGKAFTCELSRKVTKDDLYGRLKKLTIKGDDVLARGYLTDEGRCVPASSISNSRIDQEGTPVEKEEVLYDGKVCEALPSSFEEPATIELAPLTSLASFCVTDVYPLEGSALEKGLYSTWFSYRKSPERKEAFVLSKAGGVFLLVGYTKNSPLVGQIVPYELFDAEGASGDEEDDEMDFAMM